VEFAREQVASGLFSINRICYLTGISKNTYYNHIHPDERFVDKFQHLRAKIRKIIKDNSSYGVKRIQKALSDDFKIEIGRDALARLLKLWSLGLSRKIRTSKKSVVKKILEELVDRVNLLIRTKLTGPFQAISSDITVIVYNHGKDKAYLAVHKDVSGQEIYGWALGLTMEAKLVKDSFKQALGTIKKLLGKIPQDLLNHSDQGSQYTSYEYINVVLKAGLILSYSTPGTPTENAGQESFFGRFKDENKDLFLEIETFEQLKKLIRKRISYYNNKRLHTSLKLQSPKKFTRNFIKNFPK